MQEFVILVDSNDNNIGLMEKQEAHEKGLLHRAFSVFLIDSKGKLILQQRAASKYHCPLLYANTCCSHPRDGETILEAASRRLMEEMGLKCADLRELFQFSYNLVLPNGLIENEYNHVIIGTTDNLPVINKEEVESYLKKDLISVYYDTLQNADKYAPWFITLMQHLFNKMYRK